MALRPWQGPITLENVETGDGRLFADGAVSVAPLPLPLAFLIDGDQHVDLTEVAPQIGTIETVTRDAAGAFQGTGFIDDATEAGAEAIRRMEAGSAPLGNAFPVSIDGDDWAVQLIVRDPELLDMLQNDTAADGEEYRGQQVQAQGHTMVHLRAGVSLVRQVLAPLAGAAGDGDPGPDGGPDGEVLFDDAAEYWLERYTAIRIRGATLCAVAAFDGARIELVGEAATAAAGISSPAVPADPYPPLPVPAAPPRDWFTVAEPAPGDDRLVEQPDGSWAVPLTIHDDGRVYGHLATRNGAHRGYSNRVTPPVTRNGYADFHVGTVVCADGSSVNVGPLVVGGDHAPLSMEMGAARDFYANSTVGFADGVVVDGAYGPWFCGALRPGLNAADLRVLRALAPSGDWRASANGNLELICALMVNVPGFPVARDAMAAAATVSVCGPGGCGVIASAHELPGVGAGTVDDRLRATALVAAGIVARCADCAGRAASAGERDGFETDVRSFMRMMDARTRHLTPAGLDALAARIRP